MTTAGEIISEKAFQRQVEDALDLFGWRWMHPRPAVDVGRGKGWRTAIAGHKGWPDLFAVRGDRAIAIELKSESGRLTAEQETWLEALRNAGIAAYVWRPSQLDEIVGLLR